VGDVFLGATGVVLGCVAGAAALRSGHRSGNWFAYLCALGCAAFVAGIAGQRTFPSAATIQRLGQTAAAGSLPGPWDAGVSLPVVSIRLTPVAVGGFLVAAVGLSLLLLFERVPDPARPVWPQSRRLDDDDTV
jgi:hypothetical protein